MKAKTPVTILLILLALIVFAPICSAQQQSDSSVAQGNEITKPTDDLPFMKNEQAPAAHEEETGSGGMLAKTFGAMFLIVGLIFFGAWGLKKFGFGAFKANPQDAPDLTILSSVSLGSGRTISTVKFGDRVLLVGSTAQTFTLLADEISAGDDAATEKTSFGDGVAVPRSVADLLDEENDSFEIELKKAENKFGFLSGIGGRG